MIVSALAVLAFLFAATSMVLAGTSEPDGARASAAPTGETKRIDIEIGEFYIDPPTIEVSAGDRVVLLVTNAGELPHDLKLGGEVGSDMIDPSASAEVDLGVIDEPAQAWCTVPGHKEAGMVLDITVSGRTGSGGAADGEAAAVIDAAAEPADGWQPYDPALQPAPGAVEHVLTMRADETTLEVAPGVTQQMWTFDGRSPGPVLRGRVGDLFTITLVNDGDIGHSIDFHASKVAWNDEMRTIEPGESLTYQFVAKHSGIFMYHCGTAPALHHIGNGMFGAIIIDPAELAPVAHEYLFVQSELYLGPEGQPGDLTKMQGDDWDAVVFNGFHSQYLHRPIRVEPGERIRAWVLDAGPSENSSFHIVGTVFDTAYKEGAYLLRPDATNGGAQALDLQPAQGGFVEFSFDEAGLYPIVTHKFSNVGKGGIGLFQAGDVASTGASH